MSGATSPHFSNAELACHHCGRNECTPVLVDALETLRAHLALEWMNDPRYVGPFPGLLVNDAYRCPEFNRSLANAATHSQHMDGTAADVRVPGMTAATIEANARQVKTIEGIGRDDYRNYVHVDVRENAADWCYAPSGGTCAYYAPGSLKGAPGYAAPSTG